jgi:uncharacterized protein YndB with AHSA1/START domain
MDTPFVMAQVYDASIPEVWQALTDENKMRKWYFPQLKKFEPLVDFEIIWKNHVSRTKNPIFFYVPFRL